MPVTAHQQHTIEVIERVASCLSLIGTLFIFVTFISSSEFRRPINRLVFYASWGNTLGNIATMISVSGIRAGPHSSLCQFQGFLIQLFVPADAYWNFAMAFNVYLTLFRKHNAQQLKALEWKYHIACYGIPFVVALVCLFIDTSARGKVYGPATLWCWIGEPWGYLRVAILYGPAWVCIVASLGIYILSGHEIFKKRKELRYFAGSRTEDSPGYYKTTNIAVTTEMSTQMDGHLPLGYIAGCFDPEELVTPHRTFRSAKASTSHVSTTSSQPKHRAAVEANRAAWGYTKVAILFFISLLVTWVPASANRVYSLAHPGVANTSLAYVAGLVLSLMGFWNSVIYIFTSRAACRTFFINIFNSSPRRLVKNAFGSITRRKATPQQQQTTTNNRRSYVAPKEPGHRQSTSLGPLAADSFQRLSEAESGTADTTSSIERFSNVGTVVETEQTRST